MNREHIIKDLPIKNLPQVPFNTITDYKHNNEQVYNLACSFDIETSSFYNNNKKQAIMYIWQFQIEDNQYYGRTWSDFMWFISEITKYFFLSDTRYLVVYVHNLSYEFQWIRKLFSWKSVFSIDNRKPIYAKTDNGLVFKCSYLLSNLSLAKVAENLTTVKLKKLVGDLDYNKVHTPLTPLTENEMEYCMEDVNIVVAYIREQIQQCGNINKIPMTNTGFVRQYVRNQCFYAGIKDHKNRDCKKQYSNYKNVMKSLQITPQLYAMCKRAFMGGFTHASMYHSGILMYDVTSHDLTSSYPTVMVAEKYPMTPFQKLDLTNLSHDEMLSYLDIYCCIFDVEFTNLRPKFIHENIISKSKCALIENGKFNNGRVISADRIVTTITDIDFKNISDFYEWDKVGFDNFYYSYRGYLPKPIIQSILDLYQDKTKLKDVPDKVVEYLKSKGMLNSIYGMIVTDIIRDIISYDDDWSKTENTKVDENIKIYNQNKNRFLYYPWGIWVTAYARRNLFKAILELKDDYIYSDTDSVKYINAEKHKSFFEQYNTEIIEKLETALDYYNLSHELIKPKTIKNIEKPLGIYDFDGFYTRFKTLGAKRYLVEKQDKNGTHLELTVAGLNKKKAVQYINFDNFNNNLIVPKEYTGKLTHTYIDENIHGIVTDYLGNKYEYNENTSIHMESQEYDLSITQEYINLLLEIMNDVKLYED